jgi:hypothetical protein
MKRKTQKIPKHIQKFRQIHTAYNISHYNAKTGIKRSPEIVWKRLTLPQIGGKIQYYSKDDYIFEIDEEEDVIIAYSKKNLPCFKVTFSPEHGNILIDISYYPDCAHNIDLPKSKGVYTMFQMIFHFIITHKDIELYNYIQLTDNSSISIEYKGNNYFVNLANMYFLCTGCTWYSSILPIILKKYIDFEHYILDRYKIIGPDAISWSSFLEKLPALVKNKFQEIINPKSFDINKPGTARLVLNKMKELKAYTIIYHLYENELLTAFGVSSLTGKDWCLPLKDGKIVIPDHPTPETGCLDKHKMIIPEEFITYMNKNDYDALRSELQKEKLYANPIKFEKLDI